MKMFRIHKIPQVHCPMARQNIPAKNCADCRYMDDIRDNVVLCSHDEEAPCPEGCEAAKETEKGGEG